jgi:hypothetical protein
VPFVEHWRPTAIGRRCFATITWITDGTKGATPYASAADRSPT